METVFSIIVPTRNRADLLRRFLPSLAEQETDATYEIIVVDNGSKDSTPALLDEMADRYPHLRSIVEKGQGSAAARHAGVSAARSPIVCFVDDDMRVVPMFVERHLEVHRKNASACVIGQILSAASEHPFERMLAYIYDGTRLALNEREPLHSDYWSGNVSMAKEIYSRVGGYNQVFAALGYGLDLDFGMRLREKGVRMAYASGAISYHHFDERFGERLAKSYRSGIAYGYVKENFPGLVVPENVTADVSLRDRVTEKLCRFAAAIIEPFDRGTGRPILPLAYVYDRGLRIASCRGMADYINGKAKVQLSL